MTPLSLRPGQRPGRVGEGTCGDSQGSQDPGLLLSPCLSLSVPTPQAPAHGLACCAIRVSQPRLGPPGVAPKVPELMPRPSGGQAAQAAGQGVSESAWGHTWVPSP